MKTQTLFKAFPALILVSILLSVCTTINAQQVSLFKDMNMTRSSLSASQSSLYQKLEQSGGYVLPETKFVQIGALSEIASTGKIRLSVSGTDLTFDGAEVTYVSEQDYTWYGKTSGGDDLLLISKEGYKIGSASIGTSQYELHQLAGGLYAWMKINQAAFPPTECSVAESSTGATEEETGEIDGISCETRVLVLWTPAAAAATPDMNARIALCLGQTNQGLVNSQVPASTCRLVLAHQQLYPIAEKNNMQSDVANLSTNPGVQALRNQYLADIVVLITNGNYGGTLGIVKSIGPNNAEAYSIVQTNAAASAYYTFAHEVGHLFGCRHNNDNNGTYEHGHSFNANGMLRKTILNVLYEPEGGMRILNYSNPDVRFLTVPTGIANKRDNARKLRSTGCTVANFRPPPGPPPVAAYILNATSGCACSQKELHANVTGGVAPFQYEWRTSINGIDWGPIVGNATKLTVTLPCNEEYFLWVKLKVIDANGKATEVSKRILVKQC